ncbi:MAG: zinc ribbon domain-containing protein [Clostridia bacterium]|nr:zinc ribbon domain-containing protein [Clostridia bacterium]MBR2973005.1 zinc ribbon domain-containing protein [Clostridia bacterium]
MFCEKCGKELSNTALFCDGCGASQTQPEAAEPVQAAPQQTYSAPQPTPQPAPQPQQVYNNYYQAPKQPVSIGGWIGRSLIPCIPFVGAIVYLIMLFIWSGDKTKEETFNNWAKAQLWVMLIVFGVFLLLLLTGASIVRELIEEITRGF